MGIAVLVETDGYTLLIIFLGSGLVAGSIFQGTGIIDGDAVLSAHHRIVGGTKGFLETIGRLGHVTEEISSPSIVLIRFTDLAESGDDIALLGVLFICRGSLQIGVDGFRQNVFVHKRLGYIDELKP